MAKNFCLAALLLASACGNATQERAELNRRDSLRVADSMVRAEAKLQHVQDSLANLPQSLAKTLKANKIKGGLFAADLQQAGLWPMLEGETAYTLFVPADSAFAQTKTYLETLPKKERPAKWFNIMRLHLVEGSFKKAELQNGQGLRSLQGSELAITVNGGQISVNGVRVLAEVPVTNGAMYLIDKPLPLPKKP